MPASLAHSTISFNVASYFSSVNDGFELSAKFLLILYVPTYTSTTKVQRFVFHGFTGLWLMRTETASVI